MRVKNTLVAAFLFTLTIAVAQEAPPGGRGPAGGRRGGGFVPGQQRPPGDPVQIARGKTLYGIACTSCHGADLRGGDLGGPNLLRSDVVLNDLDGELIQPIVAGARQAQGMPPIKMPPEDVKAVAAYIHSIVATARGQGSPPAGPPIVLNVLVGDAKAGQAYFAANCSACHSATGHLAGIGARVPEAMQLQTLWVAGGESGRGGRGGRGGARSAEPSRRDPTATIVLPSGQKIEGRLERIDEF